MLIIMDFHHCIPARHRNIYQEKNCAIGLQWVPQNLSHPINNCQLALWAYLVAVGGLKSNYGQITWASFFRNCPPK